MRRSCKKPRHVYYESAHPYHTPTGPFPCAGDKAMHLLWRLKNKGGPAVLANQPKAVMVLIG